MRTVLAVLPSLAAMAAICVGVAFLAGWPVALIVGGVLVLADRMT